MATRVLALASRVLVGISVGLALCGAVARADGSWLDTQTPIQWNTAGMTIPAAPAASAPIDPRCAAVERPADTPLDAAISGAGWRLVGAYEGGWGMVVITATSDYDGMCRPMGYQEFVFSNDVFAGTVSPQPMASRTDGAGGRTTLMSGGQLMVDFARYSPSDPLCCPSRTTTAMYSVVTSAGGPVLTLTGANTTPANTASHSLPELAVPEGAAAAR